MSTQERDPIASGGSSPLEDSKNSRASGDKGKGSRRRTCRVQRKKKRKGRKKDLEKFPMLKILKI
jgi:hypothetical protein